MTGEICRSGAAIIAEALLQNRKSEAGSIARVPAPEVESLVCDGVRRQLAAMWLSKGVSRMAARAAQRLVYTRPRHL
jgi:hypothetical protein